ncbi:hypothetical protein AB0J90_00570 [Micromonospora sp. NPDC049523]|uniref:hypothetical protein n=1 Tax=Micromonospora sp. NPDC049523 TaxID=3155921 RepID=UPI003445B0A8
MVLPDLFSGLEHAYGGADDVPGILARIARTDRADAREAVRDLGLRVCQQGGAVNQTTPYVVGPLLGLALDPGVLVRGEVVGLLLRITRSGRAWHSAARLAAPQYQQNYTERLEWENHLLRQVLAAGPRIVQLAESANAEIEKPAEELRQASAELVRRAREPLH